MEHSTSARARDRRCTRHALYASLAFGAGTGTLNFDHTSASYVFAPTISGNGTVNVLAGTTTLTGINTYTGTTSPRRLADREWVDRPIGADHRHRRRALAAPVPSATRRSGGTLAPGNSIGTFTVNGNLTFNAGSTYLVEVRRRGRPHQCHRHRDAHRRHRAGALALPGSFRGQTYTILNAAGGWSARNSPVLAGSFAPARVIRT